MAGRSIGVGFEIFPARGGFLYFLQGKGKMPRLAGEFMHSLQSGGGVGRGLYMMYLDMYGCMDMEKSLPYAI